MNTLSGYSEILAELTADGWQVVQEGVSGAQLKKPRVMLTQTKVALAIGAVLVLAYGIGLLVIAIALIDYAMTKEQTFFLNRTDPQRPPKVADRAMSGPVKALLALIVLVVLAALLLPNR